MTTTELLELTQAYESLCRIRFNMPLWNEQIGKIETVGISCDKLSKYADVVCAAWDEYSGNVGKKSVPEVKPRASVPIVSQAVAEEHFNELWKLYPSKRGKNAVSLATKKKLYNISIDEMSKAIKRYTDDLEKRNKMDYILNGSTWFNGRYADYLDDKNYANIDGIKKVDVPETKKSRFSALTPDELSDLVSRGIITPETESVNYFAMTEMDKRMLTEKGVI